MSLQKILGAILLLPLLTGAENMRQAPQNKLLAPHARDLVALTADKLVPFDAGRFLQAPFTILYFGAGWCPDCRRFSPSLVEAYNRQPAGARSFEVLLLSHDKNATGLFNFMKSEHMPWPALAFDKLADSKDLTDFYSGQGVPCLTVIDRDGKIVLQSKSDQDGKEVLYQLQAVLRKSLEK